MVRTCGARGSGLRTGLGFGEFRVLFCCKVNALFHLNHSGTELYIALRLDG